MVAELQEHAGGKSLAGRTLVIPRMSVSAARMTAAAFRSVGVDAMPTPESNGETLEMGGACSSGEECLPHKVTIGDFLRICRSPGFDPDKTAFFMPSAGGPCRFGQYAPYLKKTLREQGFGDVLVVSPTSDDGYDGVGDHVDTLMKTVWFGIVVGDLAARFLLKTRPYETVAGDADAAFELALQEFGHILETPGLKTGDLIAQLVPAVERVQSRFASLPARYEKGRPLIGLVGEIFCRMNTFCNEESARRIERLGGECWLSDLSEWIWYTNWSRAYDAIRTKGRLNWDLLKVKLKDCWQHHYEHKLLAAAHDDFVGYEEPEDIREVLDCSRDYLPAEGALGEMTLSVGKAIYLYKKGADGIIDIAPFSCMNGIVSEAVYPAVSEDHDGIPIRSLYFDKVNTHIDRDLEIFLDLARAYQNRKRTQRVYPKYFND